MPTAARITGTFLDEITHDIPSQNWGREDWRKEFGLYSNIGIDTVVIIRAGYRNRCIFQARSIPDLLPVYEDLGRILSETKGAFYICAFQDGKIHYQKRPAYLQAVKALGDKHGVKIWSNVESFDRDMPIKFPPADWRNLRFKLESAATTAEKIITFE